MRICIILNQMTSTVVGSSSCWLIYTREDPISLGTGWYYYGAALIIKVTILHSPIRMVILDGTTWYDGNISGKGQRPDLAKQLLAVPPCEPLVVVTFLGKSNTVMLVQETAKEIRAHIFSHELFETLNTTEDCVALFQRHEYRPVTHQWKFNYNENQAWKLWNDDGQQCTGMLFTRNTRLEFGLYFG